MIRARPVIIAIVTLLALSFVWDLVTLWWEPSAREARPTSYSARAGGYRGLYELLDELHVDAKRSLLPPSQLFQGERRVLMLDPPIRYLEREKAGIRGLAEWVRDGGEVLLVTDRLAMGGSTFPVSFGDESMPIEERDEVREAERVLYRRDLLSALGIEDVGIDGPEFDPYAEADEWEYGETFRQVRVRTVEATRLYTFDEATGAFATYTEDLGGVRLAKGGIRTLEGKGLSDASGVLAIKRQGSRSGDAHVLAAMFDVGAGSITIVCEPILFMNTGIGAGDNSALAYRLATGRGDKPVIIDEYYKGGLVTGRPSVLFTMYPYGIILGLGAALAMLWSWSRVVRFGPPLADVAPPRRSIVEYVNAMGRVYRRGGKSHFALKACRRGLVEELRLALFLPAGTGEGSVLTRLERIAPSDAARLRGVLASVDEYIAAPQQLNERTLQQLQERLESCRTIMDRFRHRAK